ncbi:AsmA family protein [Aggregicoccus sp. 17bor-14]|uniref:AsmA family protein n=1 Tax=Myxococcaceae TaxID=31 RepID=UPI00129C9645|nr:MULTISPECIES: AsmA family protein [Myxococcaceae]MBF5043072.1 AsmA family protein [Simulacricoccus sp. 17bor-14]MRI88835.1 AsmA family protein [Aggregicoccus sp. 17bor-14]
MSSEPKKKRWPIVLGAIVALLVAVVLIVLWRLDAILLDQARAQAATLSQRLGRPVQVGDIDTQLFPHVGAEVQDVVVGAAAGEDAPLLELKSVDVRVALMPALRSRGKDLQVLNAEATGLTVNVIRLPDGTTNLQRLQQRLAETAPKEEPQQEQAPTDLSGVRVDRAALTDGRVRFIDHGAGAKARELAINDVDMELKDLRVGQPLDVVLKAAVLAEKQNLELRLHAAPLPATLTPVPERLVLKVEPIDLAPLAPFISPEVGFQAGHFQADWDALLGAAVPGGSGPTRLKGGFKATGLKFAGAEGGKALDVVLDTDVTGDVAKGDLALDTLRFDLGPAGINGKGRVRGLMSPTPSVEGLEIKSHDLDPAKLAEYYPPLRKQLAGQVAGPIGLSVKGSGTQAAQALVVDVDLTPVRLRIPLQLAKDAGAPMRLSANLSGAAATGGSLRFDATADLTGADLRPGLTLNKAPGQRMDVDAKGTYAPAQGKTPLRVDVSALTVHLLEDTMTGTAKYAQGGTPKAPRTDFAVDLKSAHLDADKLLLKEEEAIALNGGKPLPVPDDPNRFRGMHGDMKVQIATLRMSGLDLANVLVLAKMDEDLFSVQKLSAGLAGGTVSADGTSMHLGPTPDKRPFDAKLSMKNIDLEKALQMVSDHKVMGGTFSGDVNLKGVGTEMSGLTQTLAGVIQGDVLNGTFFGKDLFASVSEPLAKALPFAGKKLEDTGVTKFGEKLPFGLTIEHGVAQLSKPITWTRPEGGVNFTGGMKLDGMLNLAGTLDFAPAAINKLTLGKVTPTQPIPLSLSVTGPAWKPEIGGLDVKPAAKAIAVQAASGVAGKFLGEERAKQVQDVVTGGADAAKAQAQAEAEKRAAEERAKAEQRAREEADAAKQKAADEAKKKLKGLFGK